MIEPIFEKIRRIIYPFMRLIIGHEHDCCDKWWKKCSKCEKVTK